MKYLLQHYNLDKVQIRGVSAGALIATLTACDVHPDRAVRAAHRLSVENDIWNRSGGLTGARAGVQSFCWHTGCHR